MQIRLLGPVDLTDGVRAQPVPGLRRRSVLAVLALHPGEVVTADQLIEIIWNGHPPDTARNTLQCHISYLRRILGDRGMIVTRPPGYLVPRREDVTDLLVAQRLIELAGKAGDPGRAAGQLATALALWRGQPLADVLRVDWLAERAESLEQLRLDAVEARNDARLDLGEHAQLIADLRPLVRDHPFRERLHRQLALALYRAGRQVDALAACRAVRGRLSEELGVEPSPPLRRLELAILRHDPELLSPPRFPARPVASVPAGTGGAAVGAAGTRHRAAAGDAVPLSDAYLDPAGLAEEVELARFTGRASLIGRIDTFLASQDRGYVLIRAEAGVGKTSLAAYLVHTRPWHHHFTRLHQGHSPQAARRNLAAQLIRRWRMEEEWAPGGVFPAAADRPDWFDRLLTSAALRRDEREPGVPIVLVVDGLDEAERGGAVTDGGLPFGLPVHLPRGVYVIATTRLGIEWALHAIRNPAVWLTIDVDGPENLDDMRRFIEGVTDPRAGDPRLLRALTDEGVDVAWLRRTLEHRCAGVWIFLKYVLDEMRDGVRNPCHVDALPGDLAAFYAQQVQRWRGRHDHGDDADRWEHVRVPLLATLAAAREPLTVAELTHFAGIPHEHLTRVFVDETARAFLNRRREPGPPRYELRHQSLRDFLTAGQSQGDRPDTDALAGWLAEAVRAAHRRIVTRCLPEGRDRRLADWATVGGYARRHLPAHAAAADLIDELVVDPGFLTTVRPEAVLSVAGTPRTADAIAAVLAFELSLDGWAGLHTGHRVRRLHINACKTRSRTLARACAEACDLAWPIRFAWWSGTGHRVLTGHSAAVQAIAWGRLAGREVIVSGGQDGTVRIWDAASGQAIGGPLVTRQGPVEAVLLTRLAGRTVIVSAGWDGPIRIWDAGTGLPVARLPTDHIGPVYAVTVTELAGVDVLVSAGEDGTIRVVNPKTGQPAAGPLRGHRGWAGALAAIRSGDRHLIVSGGADGTVRIWDPAAGRQVGPALTGHTGPAGALAPLHLAGKDLIVSGGADGTVRIWDPAAGRQVGPTLTGHTGPVAAVASGQREDGVVVSAGWDGTVRVWDPVTGRPAARTLIGHSGQARTVTTGRISGARVVVSGGGDTTIRVWDLPPEREDPALIGHTGWVRAVRIVRVRGHDLVASGSWDTTIRLWDPVTGQAVGEPLSGHQGAVEALATGRLGDLDVIVSTGWDGTIRIWDPAAGSQIGEPLTGHDGPVGAVALGRLGDRDILVSSGADGTIRIWDPITGRQIRRPLTGHRGPIGTVALGTTGGRHVIVSTGSDATIRLWDLATGAPLGAPITGHDGWIRAAAITRVGERPAIVSSGGDATIRIWDLGSGRRLGEPMTGHRGPVDAVVAGDLDGRRVIVSGGWDATVRVWELDTARQLGEPLLGHDDWVQAVAIGRVAGRSLIISAGDDHTIFIRAGAAFIRAGAAR